MNKNDFLTLVQQRGFDTDHDVAFGTCGGFPVALALGQYNVVTAVFCVDVPMADKARGKALMKACKQGGLRKQYGIVRGDEALTFTVRVKKNDGGALLDAALQQIPSVLSAAGYGAPTVCHICHASGCDSLMEQGGAYRPVHHACAEAAMAKVQHDVQDNEMNGNYFSGILGGILGMVVGILPNLLTTVLFNTISAWLFALIPICIYFGYKLCKGRMTKVVIVVCIVLSLVGVLLMMNLSVAIAVAQETGMPFGEALVGVLGYVFTTGEGFLALMSGGAMYLVFTVLGILVAWRLISMTSATDMQRGVNAMATLRSYTPAAQPTGCTTNNSVIN